MIRAAVATAVVVLLAGYAVVTVGRADAASTLLSQGRPVTASSTENAAAFPVSAAVDGNTGSRWSSTFSDPQWLQVDLGAPATVSQVVLNWEAAYASAFQIQVSADASTWTDVYATTTGGGGIQTLNVSGTGRYVRMYGTKRATSWGYSLWEFQISGAFGGTGPPAPGTPGGVCNRYCDGRDAALAAGDRIAVTSTLYGRGFALHFNDTDAMAWASLDGGQATDEVWLDRSFDGGRTVHGSRLGASTVPAGSTARRTGQYNVDDWSQQGVGAMRACGRAGDRVEVTCTAWARSTWNAWDRRTAAATALMMRFDRSTGLFDGNGWWTGANALTAVIDNIRRSGMRSYEYVIAGTYDKNINARQGQFRNEYLDDTGWWGLAWVAAYDLTGDSRYLNTARADADYMYSYWDTGTCGGGVWWRTDRKNKNAIENSLYIQLNAMLSQRIPGDSTYRGRAQQAWAWFQNTGMLNGSNLVNDGVSLSTCRNNGDVTWTYNQGVLINGLVQLHKLTGDAAALATATRIAGAMTTSTYLSPNGILREPNESDTCGSDGASFKGAAIRGLGVLNAAVGGTYNAYLTRNADSAYAKDRDTLDMYGSHWAGPLGGTNHGCQHSALDLLNAAP